MSEAQRCPICNAPWDVHLMAGSPCILIGDDVPPPRGDMEAIRSQIAVPEPTRDQIAQAFETIRLKLINCLEEPERSAFWLAVEMRDALSTPAQKEEEL